MCLTLIRRGDRQIIHLLPPLCPHVSMLWCDTVQCRKSGSVPTCPTRVQTHNSPTPPWVWRRLPAEGLFGVPATIHASAVFTVYMFCSFTVSVQCHFCIVLARWYLTVLWCSGLEYRSIGCFVVHHLVSCRHWSLNLPRKYLKLVQQLGRSDFTSSLSNLQYRFFGLEKKISSSLEKTGW